MLSHQIAKRYGHDGLPRTRSHPFAGSAARASALPRARRGARPGGRHNDYCGKGLSGGRISVQPSPQFPRQPSENIITGNVVLYGAIAGEGISAASQASASRSGIPRPAQW